MRVVLTLNSIFGIFTGMEAKKTFGQALRDLPRLRRSPNASLPIGLLTVYGRGPPWI